MGLGLGIFLAIAAWSDWKWRKVSNWLLFPAMITGIIYHIAIGAWWPAIGGIAGGFVITVVPVAVRAMGMGDQKLLMTIGAWTSFMEVYWLFVFSAVLGVVTVLCIPQRARLLGHHLYLAAAGLAGHRRLWIPAPQQSALSIPFAVFVFGAFVMRWAAEAWL